MSDLIKAIRQIGHWDIVIHPKTFKADRVAITKLVPIIERCVVEVRGWDFPHIDRNQAPIIHLDYVEQESKWMHHAERWRFYQTGQFTLVRAMPYDRRDQSQWWPADKDWKVGAELGIGDTLFTLFEIFEFAARLSNTDAGEEWTRITVNVNGLRGRRLVVDDPMRWGLAPRQADSHIESFLIDRTVSRAQLMGGPTALAIESAQELFARFGREFSAEALKDWLSKLRRS